MVQPGDQLSPHPAIPVWCFPAGLDGEAFTGWGQGAVGLLSVYLKALMWRVKFQFKGAASGRRPGYRRGTRQMNALHIVHRVVCKVEKQYAPPPPTITTTTTTIAYVRSASVVFQLPNTPRVTEALKNTHAVIVKMRGSV
ncbi:hypothetical protein E2C01_067119 [Portunus trituberculatus]|uniref:Uncharacterized protein n=1 Tax=Portunus trituberculatus TaxID=210409 RepID=A0A5B7HSS6_PORTR|nr:hypothetical protein [Portunus trituberculatus]